MTHRREEYQIHYHGERNHQGKGNALLFPDDAIGRSRGKLWCRERLGGLLQPARGAAHDIDRPEPRLDPSRTALGGWTGSLNLNRQSGPVRVNAAAWATSPGFESNDAGYSPAADRVGAHTRRLREQLVDLMRQGDGWPYLIVIAASVIIIVLTFTRGTDTGGISSGATRSASSKSPAPASLASRAAPRG